MELKKKSSGLRTAHWHRRSVRVVDDHVVVLDARRLVLFGDLAECVQEQTITELHDVGLVDAGDFLNAFAVRY